MAISDYTYVTTQLYQKDANPNPIIAELPFTRVNFTSQLSSIGAFSGELLLSGVNSANLNVEAGTTPGKVILWVLHGGIPVWSGVIWNREYDSDTQIMKINAQEMLSYYQHRRIYKFTGSSYYQTNAGGTGSGGLVYGNLSTGVGIDPLTMLSDLLTGANASSHGNIGVTYFGPSSSSGTAIRTFFDFEIKSVYQAWKDLSTSSTFFDFLIKPYLIDGKLYNKLVAGTPAFGATYNPALNGSLNFEFPGNIVSYAYTEDASRVGNNVYGLGYGANNNRLISNYYDRSKIYGSNTWPLLEENVNLIDIVSTDLLKQTTIGKLLAIGYPPTTMQIVIPSYVDPYLGTYGVGDQVKVLINDDRFPKGLSATPTNTATVYSDGGVLPDNGSASIYRIVGIDVEPGENGPDRVTLTLNLPLATTLTAG
jgi:hypothetical protein